MTFSTTEAHLASKNARNAVERVTELERKVKALEQALQSVIDSTNKVVQTVIESTNTALGDIHSKLNGNTALLRATVDVVGAEAVAGVFAQNQRDDEDASVRGMVTKISEGLANGELKTADAIGEKSLLVIIEKDPAGKQLEFGARKHFAMSQLLPEFRASLMGKGVGATLTSASGNTFDVIEIYDLVEKAAPVAETK